MTQTPKTKYASTADAAHRHLLSAHPGARIVGQPPQIVQHDQEAADVIRALLARGKATHPEALDSVVIVSETTDGGAYVGPVVVALAHALPPAPAEVEKVLASAKADMDRAISTALLRAH